MNQVGKFQAIPKGATRSDYGIAERKRAHGDAQVNISRGPARAGSVIGSHCAPKNTTKPPRLAATRVQRREATLFEQGFGENTPVTGSE